MKIKNYIRTILMRFAPKKIWRSKSILMSAPIIAIEEEPKLPKDYKEAKADTTDP
jgi:hypothetical protein